MNLRGVKISRNIVDVLANAAIQGYEDLYKQERLGILLGRIDGDVALVQHATVYRGGSRTRTAATVDPQGFTRRVRELSKKHQSLFLGTFHSHNEVSGHRSSALTVADRSHFSEDPPHLIELIVLVWHSDRVSHNTQRYLQGHVNGCRFRIAGYQMHSPFNLIPVYPGGAAKVEKRRIALVNLSGEIRQ